MRRTLRIFATLSIVASSMLFTHSASAIGTLYSSETGSGDVRCSAYGYFTIASDIVTGTTDCYGSAVIPSGVLSIGAWAFSDSSIDSVSIPNSITRIGNSAFENARYLASITIPDSVTDLGVDVFKGDYNLLTATLGSGITVIPSRAFYGANLLTSITIPNTVTRINDGAFYNTASLTSISIPSAVTYIGTSAFSLNYGGEFGLTSITVPDSVTVIGANAFRSLRRLTSVTLGNGLTAISSGTFIGTAITSITIPNSVQSIASDAFSETSLLSSYSYCGNYLTVENLTNAGMSGKTRLACPVVITAGSEPNSQVVTLPAGITVAEIPASSSLPAIKLTFAAIAPEAVTIVPTTNSAPLSATPFMTSGSLRIVDIRIANHDGSDVTVCLEGASTDLLYHYTGGEWVELRERSYQNGQVCGVTNTFSPFTAAPARPLTISNFTANQAAAEAAAKREAEIRAARAEIIEVFKSSKAATAESFAQAEIRGITKANVDAVNAEIALLPQDSRTSISEIVKIARKFEVVGVLASDQIERATPNLFVEIGLISAENKNKTEILRAIRGLSAENRGSYASIKSAIAQEMIRIQMRKDRLTAVLARISGGSGK